MATRRAFGTLSERGHVMLSGILISSDSYHPTPAVGCVRELDNVIAATLGLELCRPFKGEKPAKNSYDFAIYTALDYRELVTLVKNSSSVSGRSKKIAYVFDAFLSKRFRSLPRFIGMATSYAKTLQKLDVIYTPVNQLCAEHSRLLGVVHKFLPIGVDCVKYGLGGQVDKRWIQVNAYGRQPKPVTDALSDALNHSPGSFFYHTDHMQISCLNDTDRHRALFWQTLRSSKIAVAYAPEAYDPAGRFQCSFIGQRWFEALAAGCLIVGKAPSAFETSYLFDWENALIELPTNASDVREFILDLLEDEERLRTTSVINYAQCLSRHDWRHRIKVIVDEHLPELKVCADLAASEASQKGGRMLKIA